MKRKIDSQSKTQHTSLTLNIDGVKPTLVETDFPKVVIFESSTYCNLNCIMCPQDRIHRSNQFMDFKVFKKAIEEITVENKECEVWFAIMGEPLVNPELLLKMIGHAKNLGLNNLNLNTNGCLLTTEISQKLLKSGIAKTVAAILIISGIVVLGKTDE